MDQGDITGTEVPDRVEIAGIFISVEFKKTKKNDNMAICLLEDLDSEIKVVVFPKAFEKFADKLNAEEPLLVKGKIDFNGKEAQILADEIELLKDLPDIVKTSIVNIKLEEREVKHDNLNYLKQILKGNPGHNPVIFHLYDLEQGRKVNIRAGREYFITVNEAILEKIRKISCVEDIWVNGH
jgi:DNA polymerase-3 subunit alpha